MVLVVHEAIPHFLHTPCSGLARLFADAEVYHHATIVSYRPRTAGTDTCTTVQSLLRWDSQQHKS